jgi:hypothetical protein
MTRKIILATLLLMSTPTLAQQQTNGTDPIFWCDISRGQVSHERDAALADIERLKIANANLAAKIKELEMKANESAAEKGKPNE